MNAGYSEYDDVQLGDVRLDNEVIKNIAIKAATEVEGVHALQRGRVRELWNTLSGKSPALGAKLEFHRGTGVSVKLDLMVEYGVSITDAAALVQESVKKAIEHMTGLSVVNVTVNIMGIHLKK